MSRSWRSNEEEQWLQFEENWASSLPITALDSGITLIREDAPPLWWPAYMVPAGWAVTTPRRFQEPRVAVVRPSCLPEGERPTYRVIKRNRGR